MLKLLSLPHLVSKRDLYAGNYSPEYHRASRTAAVVELVEVSMRVHDRDATTYQDVYWNHGLQFRSRE